MELEDKIRCNELLKEKHSNWLGLSNQKAIRSMLEELDRLQEENEELKEIDLTTVHIKGVCDEKERWRNKIREKIEEYTKSLAKMFKEDYAKKQKEQPNQDVLVVAGIRNIAKKAKIEALKDLLKEE